MPVKLLSTPEDTLTTVTCKVTWYRLQLILELEKPADVASDR